MSKKFTVIVADPPYSFSDTLSHSNVKRGAQANYDIMSISDIKELPVKNLIDPDGSILALWVPSSLLQEGLDTMKAWGFTQKQSYIWIKSKKDPFAELTKFFSKNLTSLPKNSKSFGIADLNTFDVIKHYIKSVGQFNLSTMLSFGLGRIYRQSHEICLIGTSNNKIYQKLANKSQRSVSFAPNLGHSIKPECLQDSLDIMFPGMRKIELFARRQRPGWNCIGNEAPATHGEDIRVSLAKL